MYRGNVIGKVMSSFAGKREEPRVRQTACEIRQNIDNHRI